MNYANALKSVLLINIKDFIEYYDVLYCWCNLYCMLEKNIRFTRATKQAETLGRRHE